jgi:hypothetical protein
MTLRIVDDGRAPDRILCQGPHGSCASCCGTWNFRDRSPRAMHVRLLRRTERVRAAWPDVTALARARDMLLDVERSELLTHEIPVCPFAGYVDTREDAAPTDEPRRIGCLLHPTRHPTGEDLRDLAVYPRDVCAGHFCAPHDWLRDVEKDVASCARGLFYGRVVTDAGLVKALVALVEDALCRRLTSRDVEHAARAWGTLFDSLADWPFVDDDPHRFGGFTIGDDAIERTITDPRLDAVAVKGPVRTVLDALGTRVSTDDEARAASRALAGLISDVAQAIRTI